MNFYQTKIPKIPGTNYAEVKSQADLIFKQIKSKTKRKPYLRSAYFNKQKIFFDYFWLHLRHKKSVREKALRLKCLPCAIDLIKNSKIRPVSKENPNNKGEFLHRFYGQTKSKEKFAVQIKEDKKTNKKDFMSCFPWEGDN